MKFLIRSLASPLVYRINCVNLPLGSSIFFLTNSFNTDIKYVYSREFPSNGSKSTCSVDCSFTNFYNISVTLFCGPVTGSFCSLLSSHWRLSSLRYTFCTLEEWMTLSSSPLLQLGYRLLILLLESASDITTYFLRIRKMTDPFFLTITPTRISPSHIPPWISSWYNCQIR